MASKRPIRLITFDLDNTLWPVHEVILRADADMRSWLGEQLPGFSAQFLADDFMALRQRLVADNPTLQHDLSKMRIAVLTEAMTQFGQKPKQAAALAAAAFEVFIHGRHQVRYFEGAERMLANLADRYTLAALTNGNADFSRLSISKHLSFGYSSASVGVSKPHPDIFNAALAHAQVDADQALHVGDHPVDDIHGAAAVGMRTVLVCLENLPQPATAADAHPPDAQISNLTELTNVIAALEA